MSRLIQNMSMNTIKKSNIQKSVSWCEKLKIPYNRFSEKTNIFLPIIKENKDYDKEADKIIEDNDNDDNIVVEVMDEIIVIEEL